MELGIDVRKEGSHAVVDVKGEIDVYTAPKLREKLIELVSEGSYNVVVNLEGVDFLDSTGLGVLVGALKRVKAHDGSLSLVCTQDKILKIFKITGLTKVFPIHESIEEAVDAGSSSRSRLDPPTWRVVRQSSRTSRALRAWTKRLWTISRSRYPKRARTPSWHMKRPASINRYRSWWTKRGRRSSWRSPTGPPNHPRPVPSTARASRPAP